MKPKQETTILILALLITSGLVGGAVWWFINNSGKDPSKLINNQSRSSTQFTDNVETFGQVQNVPSGLFNYGGSSTWVTIRKEVDPFVQVVWPKFQLRYTQPNSGAPSSETGVEMLLNNQLDFSQYTGIIPNKFYTQAKERGITIKEIPVAIDAIAVVVNPKMNIPGLTVQQLDDIYAGKITNWNQVRGPDLKIKPYIKLRDAGSHLEFVATTTEALRQVAANPGGIFKASAPLLVPQCNVKPLPLGLSGNDFVPPYKEPFIPLSECPGKRNQLNIAAFRSGQYPATRRLLIVLKQNGQIAEQAGEAYAKLLLTNQGQELIEKSGFVRIR